MNVQTDLVRCPACGTVFRGPASLPAHGRVRCGVCNEVFAVDAAPPQPDAQSDRVDPRPAHVVIKSRPAASGRASLLYGALALFLLLVLLGQIAWLGRDRLADMPRLRPLVAGACAHIGCALPTFRDLSAIRVVDASVTSHPDYDAALLAVVTLDNTAPLPQPWPRLAVALTGADDTAVAERLFEPAEYLPAERQGDPAFAAGAVIQVRLPLADPGMQAAGFRFTVH